MPRALNGNIRNMTVGDVEYNKIERYIYISNIID